MPRFGNHSSRVDLQVSIIVAVLVALSFICVFSFTYSITYNNMIDMLKARTDSIYSFIEDKLDKSTFETIESGDDAESESYRQTKEQLETVRESTGVRYLYTAKRTDDGELIYVIDGLPSESEDFRFPGDAIEEEITGELDRALADERVYPNDIKDTGWGYVFVSYYPIHENGEVIGAIGIEFDAEAQYQAFRMVRIGTPLIGIVFGLAAIVFARFLFRRISNPAYKDLSNTDYLTSLRNRNAFDIDISNWEAEGAAIAGAFVIDLDRLKLMNDRFGHSFGDEYLCAAAKLIEQLFERTGTVYRIGGDEFAVLCRELDEDRAHHLMSELEDKLAETALGNDMRLSLSCGFAIRKPGEALSNLVRRADVHMYEMKREHRGQKNRPRNQEAKPSA
ncbi:GGDEF domain-containing protein [Raoultibacter massiliensis]|uniref:Diguanylate cyclase n=1 Tax=Raoultibacter massiliensis TaxID=1852371 RepID=A0ABV1JDR0_9ACTN